MCIICAKLGEKNIAFYDARIMAGEYRNMIGEEHYKELIKLLDILENPPLAEPKKEEKQPLEDYEEDEYMYYGNFGGSDD